MIGSNYEMQRGMTYTSVIDDQLDGKITFIQRHVRFFNRLTSEVDRILPLLVAEKCSSRYGRIDLSDPNERSRLNIQRDDFEIKAARCIENANLIYLPKKASKTLSRRILEISSQVKLFSSVSHLAASNNIAVIIDECLYGRKNLEDLHLKYRPAALSIYDKVLGDENVICMGPKNIDPICLKDRTTGLELDLNILISSNRFKKNPCAFFKQKDFLYNSSEVHSVHLSDMELRFILKDDVEFKVLNANDEEVLTSYTSSYKTMSYNVQNMDQILIMNFFRFLEGCKITQKEIFRLGVKTKLRGGELEDFLNKLDEIKIKEIYDKMEDLTDSELRDFLTQVGKKSASSSEFNFYGAYKIDLDALVGLKFYQGKNLIEHIKISELAEALKKGDRTLLKRIAELNPELLDSQRFVKFLDKLVS